MGRIHSALSGLDLPLALVWGMRDPIFQPVFCDEWRELFPSAQLTTLVDAGHYLLEDSPTEVSDAIVRFAGSV